MTAETLLKFARKGIILTPGAYDLILGSDNPLDLSSSIILKLKSGKYSNEDYPLIAATPGRTLPSIASSRAPPPVEI